jgi:hypothetical protein
MMIVGWIIILYPRICEAKLLLSQGGNRLVR